MKIGQEQQILVEVGEFEFCIDLDEVISIINPPKMVRLPSARGAFIRAFKYQDELGAAVSMRIKFGLPEREDMAAGQILLGRLNGRLAGFWFDRVKQILKIGDGAQWFPIPAGVSLPTPEFDTFVRFQERLIPHSSLMGLLRFEQAEAWKEWLEREKPRLEAGLAEAEAEEQAPVAPSESQWDDSQVLISLDDFYALMDEAGVSGLEESPLPDAEVPPPEVTVEVSGEAQVPAQTPEAEEPTEQALGHRESGEEAAEVSIETIEAADATPTLAVPVVVASEEQAETADVSGEPSWESEATDAAEPAGEDALFTLERKRDDIRKRMDPSGDANLGDYSIIKVGDKSLFRFLRRWLRRLVVGLILVVLGFVIVQGVQYQQQQQLTLERVWIHTAEGGTDWMATKEALQKELSQFGRFLQRSIKVK